MARKERIFISYRRGDDLTMTGRLHDRLTLTFGKAAVFKDMEDIPAGADFRVVLEEAIASSQVVLVIIGQKWLNLADSDGNRRLDNPNDFVRTEIESALVQDHILLIPVLIEGATMPSASHLPDSIKELAYRNAVAVRNDPDFSHDMDQLCAQINAHLGHGTAISRISIPVAIGAVVIAALLALVILLSRQMAGSMNDTTGFVSAGVATVAPVPNGKYLILVAKPEPIRNPTPRDVGRFITENLNRILDKNTLFSETMTQYYEVVIKSDAEAKALADKVGATIIVWGSYTDQEATLNIQIGSFKGFSHVALKPDLLERTMNVHVRIADERTQSIAPEVLSVLLALQVADDDVFDFTRTQAILSLLTVDEATLIMDSNSANSHRMIHAYFSDPSIARKSVDQAIKGDASNPLLYLYSAQLYLLQGDTINARHTNQSARSFATEGWLTPLYQLAAIDLADGKLDQAAKDFDTLIKAYPKDWYAVYLRGISYYFQGKYERAQADIEKSLSLNPPTSFPYYFAMLIALRDGRISDVQQFYTKIRHDFPDPTLGTRILEITLGKSTPSDFDELFKILGQFLLQDYAKLATESDYVVTSKIISVNTLLADLYMIRGFAHCNLNDDKTAEEDYTQALEYDEAYISVYMLRADVRSRLGNLLGAGADLLTAQSRAKSPELSGYIEANRTGQFTCKNALDYVVPTATAQP